MYNLRKVRDPFLKRIHNALPTELLEYIYVLAITPRPQRYALRPKIAARSMHGPQRPRRLR